MTMTTMKTHTLLSIETYHNMMSSWDSMSEDRNMLEETAQPPEENVRCNGRAWTHA